MQPIYTRENCRPAYQLRWSLTVFPKTPTVSGPEQLQNANLALQGDGIRILEVQRSVNGSLQFLLSSIPAVSPQFIVQRVKGRWRHLFRSEHCLEWRRNFRLTAVGDANAETVVGYVRNQLEHHGIVAARDVERFGAWSVSNSSAELSQPLFSRHGQYVLGLHVVLVHAERWGTGDSRFLQLTNQMVQATTRKYRCLLAELSLLPDHLHWVVRFDYELSPEQLALAAMNNIAYALGMKRIWANSYYVGTLGPYDMNAVWQSIQRKGTSTEMPRDQLPSLRVE